MEKYQIYISHRRNGGMGHALKLHDTLTAQGYSVYLDVEVLGHDGIRFDIQLQEVIGGCQDFLLILSPNALNRCWMPDDWTRNEIELALTLKKNIILIIMPGFRFPPFLPAQIEPIRHLEGVMTLLEFWDASVERIENKLTTRISHEPNHVVSSGEQTIKPYRGDQKYIFISYAHKDKQQVLPIITYLQQHGYRVWYDEGIVPGTEWDKEIAEHIVNCGYFVAFISQNYLESSNCKDELNFARDRDKNRFLVYIEKVQLPAEMQMRMSRIQNIHKYAYTDEETFFDKLLQADRFHEYKD